MTGLFRKEYNIMLPWHPHPESTIDNRLIWIGQGHQDIFATDTVRLVPLGLACYMDSNSFTDLIGLQWAACVVEHVEV